MRQAVVEVYCVAVAEAMGLPDSELESIARDPLHRKDVHEAVMAFLQNGGTKDYASALKSIQGAHDEEILSAIATVAPIIQPAE